MAWNGLRARCSIALVLAAMTATVGLAQLQPPAGPVEKTMKRLDQVEPRRCVNSLPGSPTAVHVISEPGNYVLTGDVVGQDRKSGIEVTCDGDVTLDMNGFSLVGVAGSLHGVHHTGGSGGPQTRRTYAQPHVFDQKGRIHGWGGDGLNLNNLDVCEVGGLLIEDCGGAAVRIASHDIALNAIRNMKAFRCGGGGIAASMTASSGGGAGKASFQDIHISSCTGNGLYLLCSSSATCDVSVERCSVSSCSGHGMCIDRSFGGGGGGGGAGKCHVHDISVSSCTGDGLRCVCAPGWTGPDCSVRDVTVSDVGGHGIHMLDVAVDFKDVFCSRCAGNGLHVQGTTSPVSRVKGTQFTFDTTIFANYVSNVTDVSLTGGTCISCVEDGIRCEDVALCYIGTCDATGCGVDGIAIKRVAKFKAGAELAGSVNRGCRVTGCGGIGLSILDCPDASTSGMDVSACLEAGISHDWTVSPNRALIAHEAAHVVQCGTGLRVTSPESIALDPGIRRCVFSSNTESGISIVCPASSSVSVRCDDSSCNNNGGSGMEVRCHPGSSVQCSCSHLMCVHNGGSGVVVDSTDPALTLSSGSFSLSSSMCSSNGGTGCACACPLHASSCVFSENESSGVDVRVASSFDHGGSMIDCTLHRNALHGARCGPGKFAHADCDASDNGGDGLRCESGCLIADSCLCNRNGGDGLHVVGTLTVSGGAMRRNGGGGVRCFDGTCAMSDCVCELNGANPGVTGGGALFVDCSSVTLQRCSSSNNTGPGMACASSTGVVCVWSSIDCMCSGNTLDGMRLNNCAGAQVLRCVLSGNGGWGVHCPQGFSSGKVESCSCMGNGGGILVLGQGNLVVSNTCSIGPIGGLSVTMPGNAVGRIVDASSLISGDCDKRSNLVH